MNVPASTRVNRSSIQSSLVVLSCELKRWFGSETNVRSVEESPHPKASMREPMITSPVILVLRIQRSSSFVNSTLREPMASYFGYVELLGGVHAELQADVSWITFRTG